VSGAAAALLGDPDCRVLAMHRQGVSLQAPGSPEVIFLSRTGTGLLPVHVLVTERDLGRVLAMHREGPDRPALRIALEGARRFTVRIAPAPEDWRRPTARLALEGLGAWLCSQPGATGLGETAAALLAPGNPWQAALEPCESRARRALRRLLGRGSGSTPAGDDFLVGALAFAWARGGGPACLIRHLGSFSEEFQGLTTAASATYLRAGLRGEFGSHLTSFARALPRAGWDAALPRALRVAAHGSTSGVDTLTGFLAAARAWDHGS
jgi:hypothetical protein